MLPSLEAPERGDCCPVCGTQRGVVDYCGECDDRERSDRQHARARDSELRSAEQDAIRRLSEWNRQQAMLDLDRVRRRARAYRVERSEEDLTPAEIREERSIRLGEAEMQDGSEVE